MRALFPHTHPWARVAIFYMLACAWSWPFFWWRDLHPESWRALPYPPYLKTWFSMWGPGISALLCFALFGTGKRTITAFGSSPARSALVYLTPCLALIALDPKSWFFLPLGLISITGEEFGWRGWLQDHLAIKGDAAKACVIGVLWELWHFTNRTANGTWAQAGVRVGIFIVVLSLMSYLMLRLTRRSASLLVAVTVHFCFNLAFEHPQGLFAIAISAPVWIALFWRWPAPPARPA